MKRFLVLTSVLVASLASATPSDTEAKAVVEKALIAPLKVKEQKQSRFSRAYIPPQVRRVRVEDKALTDAKGGEFMTFAIDSHHGYGADDPAEDSKSWRKDAITGCVYPGTGEIFVKRGDKYIAATVLLGKKSATPGEFVCKADGEQVAAR